MDIKRFCVVVVAVAMFCSGVAAAQDAIVSSVVSRVSQSQYTQYQQDIEKCGTGFYGGAAYNQGWADRTWYNTVKDANGEWVWVYGLSKGNAEARLYLTDKFSAMGLSVSEVGETHNIVATLPGTKYPEKEFLVCGHFDTHPGSIYMGGRPGGDDNASGTAGVLEMARVLANLHPDYTIKFMCFNGEESVMDGSKEYCDNLTAAQKSNIMGMINMDMILRPCSDADPNWTIDLDICTKGESWNLAWAQKFQTAAATYVPSLPIDPTVHTGADDWGGSDHVYFASFCPSMMLIDNTPSEVHSKLHNSYYHGSGDCSDGPAGAMFDYAFATDTVRASLALIAQEAGVTTPEPTTLGLLLLAAVPALRRRRRASVNVK